MILITGLQYFTNIIEYKNLITYKHINLEQYERWQKASFRSRCIIAGANGLIHLSIPVQGGRHSDSLIREIKIDHTNNWQKIHWRSIVSAYNRSPWFEYFRDEIEKFYHTRYTWLWDWNYDLFEWVNKKTVVELNVDLTKNWQKKYPETEFDDWRYRMQPRNFSSYAENCPVYKQVFEERFGFLPNLSIIDLLFCEGPNAANLLRE